MSAWQYARLKVQPIALECLNHLQRVFTGKRQIVIGIYKEHALLWPAGFGSGKALVITARAHRRPQRTHAILRQSRLFQGLLHVARALPRPGHVSKRRGRMIERIHADALVIRAGQKRIAGAEAGAQHAEMFVTLVLKPVKATACLHAASVRPMLALTE